MSWELQFLICSSRGFGEKKIVPRLGHVRLTLNVEPGIIAYVCRNYAEFELLNQEAVKHNLNNNKLWCAVRLFNPQTGAIKRFPLGEGEALEIALCNRVPPETLSPNDKPRESASSAAPATGVSAAERETLPPAGEPASGRTSFDEQPPPLPESPPVRPAPLIGPAHHSSAAVRQTMRTTGRKQAGGGTVRGSAPSKPARKREPATAAAP